MVEDFIKRRFPIDCHWLDGNCYYFAVILKARFPEGTICYDLIDGHFIFEYKGALYDWTGKIDRRICVDWEEYQKIDPEHSARIIRDVVK